MSYNDPQFQIKEERLIPNLLGIASTTMVKWKNFQRRKLMAISAIVNVAGTNDVAGIDLFVGTTSVGALTVGTATASSIVTATFTGVFANDGDMIEIKGKATSATLNCSYTLLNALAADGTVANAVYP